MSGCIIPEGYTPRLNVYETQRAIEFIKRVGKTVCKRRT